MNDDSDEYPDLTVIMSELTYVTDPTGLLDGLSDLLGGLSGAAHALIVGHLTTATAWTVAPREVVNEVGVRPLGLLACKPDISDDLRIWELEDGPTKRDIIRTSMRKQR
jgi:hypothetical protein